MTWHSNIMNDPYDEYRDPRGCGRSLIVMALIAASLLFLLFCAVGCKTQPLPTNTRDSVRVEFRYDSVYIYQHDSIFRDRWRSGDTTYIVTEKWRVLYKDKIVEVHDTLSASDVQYIKEQYVPAYYKNVSTGFWILLVILLGIVAFKVYKVYIKIQSGGIL